MKKVLLLGASGQLGRQVATHAPDSVNLVSLPRDMLDITNHEAVGQAIEEISPEVIINTAAYTRVDQAEKEEDQAYLLNADAVGNIGRVSGPETTIIHLSTDFVFSQINETPYKPGDTPDPVSVYGKSKLEGEKLLLAEHPQNAVVLRTSWLYAAGSKNFVTTMLELMSTRDSIGVVNDQYGSPTSAATLAEVIWLLLDSTAEGIYHWSDNGVITWYDFACEIQRQALQLGLLQREVDINPIPTSDYPTPAQRPVYSALDSSTTESILDIKSQPWDEQLHKVLSTIKGSFD